MPAGRHQFSVHIDRSQQNVFSVLVPCLLYTKEACLVVFTVLTWIEGRKDSSILFISTRSSNKKMASLWKFCHSLWTAETELESCHQSNEHSVHFEDENRVIFVPRIEKTRLRCFRF